MIEVTRSTLAEHPFLRGMAPGHLDALAEVGADVSFPAGHSIFQEGGFAGKFWLIQSGHLALGVQVPGEGRVVVDNVVPSTAQPGAPRQTTRDADTGRRSRPCMGVTVIDRCVTGLPVFGPSPAWRRDR
jgi:hypothetical protein